jgi:prevent-host-death family protein
MEVAASQAREELDELVDIVHDRTERVRLLLDGRPMAALISADDLRMLEQLEDAADLRAIEEAMADPENAGQPIPWEEVQAELDRLAADGR